MKAKPDWSKIGRHSRRKGKAFECRVAGMFRAWTGLDWQTTRNSGRTDLAGDVYCLDPGPFSRVLIECKDRKEWGLHGLMTPTAAVRRQMLEIEQKFASRGRQYGMLLVVVNTKVGIFMRTMGTGGIDAHPECPRLVRGREVWYHAPGVGGIEPPP